MPTLRWQPIATLLLSVFGLGVSIYLTITHFSHHALVCVEQRHLQLREGHHQPAVGDLRDPGGHARALSSSSP